MLRRPRLNAPSLGGREGTRTLMTDKLPEESAQRLPQVVVPEGFGKDVNSYLNQYVAIADAKAVAFLAASLAAAAVSFQSPASYDWIGCVTATGTSLFLIAATLSSVVLFPRLPSAGTGAIFWEDIRTYKSAEHYWESARELRVTDVEKQYASQNYHVSSVLHTKHVLLRGTMITFSAGVLTFLLVYLAR